MPRATRITTACLLCVVVGFLGGMGCPAFEALLSGGPAGFPFAGVRLRIENQSGFLTRVVAVYHLGSEEVRRTDRLLPPDGNESSTEVIRTLADDIMVVATVAGNATLPAGSLVQLGDMLIQKQFRRGQDFFGGETLVLTIPAPQGPPTAQIIDCNRNGITDNLDIQNGTSIDCNGNTIPDECEIDMNSDAAGGPFFCDPAVNSCAADCNGNGVPDECDICPPGMTPTGGLGLRLSSGQGGGAGVVIIGGDDFTDHGSVIEGIPQNGWLYIQRALESIAPLVTRFGNDGSIAALGSAPSEATSSDAGAAIGVAANAAGLAVTYYEGEVEINGFFADLTTGTANPAIIWTAGTGAPNDLDTGEGLALTNNAVAIANFVNSGGGLLSHGSGNNAYGWLTALLPGLNHVNSGSSGDLSLTAAGMTAFPGVTDANINAGPWHNHFEGDLQGLAVLAESSRVTDASGNPAAVIIGGAGVSLPGQITLSPDNAAHPVNTTHGLTATVVDGQGAPLAGVDVDFTILEGPNSSLGRSSAARFIAMEITDAAGMATFSYLGAGGPGVDRIQASFLGSNFERVFSNVVSKIWEQRLCSPDCNANGIPDECESDSDDDGVIDDCDNCVNSANPDQADADGDGVGDACTPPEPALIPSAPGSAGGIYPPPSTSHRVVKTRLLK